MNTELGEYTDIEVILMALNPTGKRIVDAGCGDGELSRLLAEQGATVTGIEPDAYQAAKNRKIGPVKGVELIEAGAQALPLDDASQDAVIFRFSFHHIPESLHAEVIAEAARVLKPEGALFVIEPIAAGSSQAVMALFHDETRVRAQVQATLATIVPEYFHHRKTYRYQKTHAYTDFSGYLDRYARLTYNSYSPYSVDNARVRNKFSEFRANNGITELTQPIKADLFIKST